MREIKVMIAEDHKIYRKTIAIGIPAISDRIEIIGVAEDGKVLLDLIKIKLPDIVLLDLNMPELDGWKVLGIFKEKFPSIKTIIFSGDYNEFSVARAVLDGASSYIDKWKSDENDLVAAIESVYDYGYYFNDIAAQEIILALKDKKQISFLIENQKFSEREIKIIDLICQGMQVKEIGGKLNISDSTVKYHKGNLYTKTESKTKLDILKYAISKGIYNVSFPSPVLNTNKKR